MKELHNKQVQKLKSDNKYLRTIHRYKMTVIIGTLLIIILILALILYRNKQRNRAKLQRLEQEKLIIEKDHLQKELEFKNRELTTSVMYLLQKNNFMQRLNDRLKSAIIPLKPEAKKPIADIIKETDRNIESDTWKEFEKRFNEVHHDFSSKLIKAYPSLSPNELKLCAFLRLNMSTKEIMTITHQSSNSIGVARYRLRTKLGIDRDENLVTYLSKY